MTTFTQSITTAPAEEADSGIRLRIINPKQPSKDDETRSNPPDYDDVVEDADQNPTELSLPAHDVFTMQTRGLIFRDLTVNDADKRPAYFSDISEFKSAPDVTLHRGDINGPTVGHAHFRFSWHLKLGVGDFDATNAEPLLTWTTMKYKHNGFRWGYYRLEWHDGWYRWERYSDPNASLSEKILDSSWKFVDEQTGNTIATYHRNRFSCRYKATLRVSRAVDQDMQALVVLGAAGLSEKARRRAARSSGGGGGGGGGGD